MKEIKIIVIENGKFPEVKEVTDNLEIYREIVGGNIECLTLSNGLIIICNEEGKLLGLPVNKVQLEEVSYCFGDCIHGNYFLARCDEEGEFISVTQEDIDMLVNTSK